MKRISLMTTAICAAIWTAPASATDPDAPAAFNWTGGYVGASVGYGWGDSTLDFDVINYIVPYDPDGFMGGVHAGYNHQFSNDVVLGVEADFQLSGMGSSNVLGISNGVPGGAYRYYSEQKWNAALRARLGYAADRFLPYLAGGLAVAQYEHGESVNDPFSATGTYLGWTVGAGLEFAATENVVLRTEYRYADFGSQHFVVPGWFSHVVDLKSQDVRFGISYRF